MYKVITKKKLNENTLSNQSGFIDNIEKITEDNDNFRKVIYTANNCQLVAMSLDANEDIGAETHTLDQFFRIEEGTGISVIDGKEYEIYPGAGIIIPAGVKHNIINTGDTKLKLYSIYSPPNHKDGTIHKTKEIAKADDEHFDGETTT